MHAISAEAEKDVRPPETGVAGICESHDMEADNVISGRERHAF